MRKSYRVASVLLDSTDEGLARLDRRIRHQMFGRSAETPGESGTSPGRAQSAAGTLWLIYRAIKKSYEDEQEAAITDLRDAENRTDEAQLKARALQCRAQLLYTYSLNQDGAGNQEAAAQAEAECRELCERGLREYIAFPWSANIRYVLRTALAALDYNAGESVSAKLHLEAALNDFRSIRHGYDKKSKETIGYIHYYLGRLSQDRGDLKEAVRLYRRALRELGSDGLIMVGLQLARASLELRGGARYAKRIALRALRRVKKRGRPAVYEENLWLCVARAELLLGKRDSAKASLGNLVQEATDENVRASAREWLKFASRDGK